MWQNHTQSVREYSWTSKTGLTVSENGNSEFKIFQSKKAAVQHSTETEDVKREKIVQQKSQRHLENLIRSSESGKPFSKNLSLMTDCEFCPMKYLSRQALRAHEKAVHMDKNEIWLCMFCSKTYISRHELRTHIVTRHPVEFRNSLSTFHSEQLRTEEKSKELQTLDQKDGQLLCDLCNTVCKTFGLFSLTRLTDQQKSCLLNHKATSAQKAIRWFMKTHFPYFYDKFIALSPTDSKVLTESQRFHVKCPLKVTHLTQWKRDQKPKKRPLPIEKNVTNIKIMPKAPNAQVTKYAKLAPNIVNVRILPNVVQK